MFMTYFKQTCDKPYDRHKYKLVFKNKKAVVFDDCLFLFEVTESPPSSSQLLTTFD